MMTPPNIQCDHDGGTCHHQCASTDKASCFRALGGMHLTTPWPGFLRGSAAKEPPVMVLKRYRVCEMCRKHRAFQDYDLPCFECGKGDCAPGVVDVGVVWQFEVPTEGEWWAWNPVHPLHVYKMQCKLDGSGVWLDEDAAGYDELRNGWRFTPRTTPDPPRE